MILPKRETVPGTAPQEHVPNPSKHQHCIDLGPEESPGKGFTYAASPGRLPGRALRWRYLSAARPPALRVHCRAVRATRQPWRVHVNRDGHGRIPHASSPRLRQPAARSASACSGSATHGMRPRPNAGGTGAMSAARRARPAARTLRTAGRTAAASGLSARNRSAVQGGRHTRSRISRCACATVPRATRMPVIRAERGSASPTACERP